MPRIFARLAALAGLLVPFAFCGPAMADAPGYTDDAPSRAAPRRLAHRPLPIEGRAVRRYDPYAGRPVAYRPVVRAYLPRNNNVPMYNEPPAR